MGYWNETMEYHEGWSWNVSGLKGNFTSRNNNIIYIPYDEFLWRSSVTIFVSGRKNRIVTEYITVSNRIRVVKFETKSHSMTGTESADRSGIKIGDILFLRAMNKYKQWNVNVRKMLM